MRMFYFEELDTFPKKVKNILGKLSAKRAKNVYCASQDHANDMISKLSLRKDKVKVIHLGFTPITLEKNSTRKVRGNNLLFVSVIRPYKNLHGLVDAVLLAKEKRPDLDIKLDVVGKPAQYAGIEEYMNNLYSRVATSKYSFCVNFLGPKKHNEVLELLTESKCLIFPTLFEGFGLPLLEAMATETPVLSSNVNSLPEISNSTTLFC